MIGMYAFAYPNMIVEHYTAERGLPNNIVNCTLKGQDGFIWFGTWYGLCSFDGSKFRSYDNHDGFYSTDIPPRKIQRIVEDKNGFLWIKTIDRKLYLFDKRHESFHAVYDDVKEYSENNQIIKIQTTEDGDVLLLTKDKSLLRAYTDKEGKITMKQLHDSRPNVNVYDMRLKHNIFCETAEFINWIGMDYQILSLRKGEALKDKPADFIQKKVSANPDQFTCASYNSKFLWLGDKKGHIYSIDPQNGVVNRYEIPEIKQPVSNLLVTESGLMYWPMLKSGDFDMMPSQFDFYNRMLKNAELRSRVYWQHNGACFSEQIENFGLPNPAEYGFKRPDWFDKGLEYNAWLEYEWDTVLEFCQMILETKNYANADITPYLPLIESSLTFFDEHYRQLASRRGRKALDGNGHLILFPGSACETYKMTNNASSTIAALKTVLETYGKKEEMLKTIPPIPLRYIEIKDTLNPTIAPVLKQTISPAVSWERINNVETPQLYPVFPWRIYGVGKEDLDIARNTYFYDPDAIKFRSHTGWKQDNIWAACLGLTEEAKKLSLAKLSNGPHRFPAFWGPGYDWTPDHNWGGTGMIGLQEMLLQTNGEQILLFPAWPKEWNVHFKLHAPGETTVEATLKNGKVTDLKVLPESREKDIVIMIEKEK